MPVPNERAHFKNRRGIRDLHQNDDGSGGGDGRGRVHDDAQRAMIRIAGSGVHVGHLDNRKKDQQCQTHQRHCRKSGRPATATV